MFHDLFIPSSQTEVLIPIGVWCMIVGLVVAVGSVPAERYLRYSCAERAAHVGNSLFAIGATAALLGWWIQYRQFGEEWRYILYYSFLQSRFGRSIKLGLV